MTTNQKRELLRHLVATVVFRGRLAISDAPESFADFKIAASVRTPAEILAHIGDLLQGSLFLMQGEMVYLNSKPRDWNDETQRFFAAAREFDLFLASDAPLHQPIEKITQGPIADALTHIGQIVLIRRAADSPIRVEGYFATEIIPDEIHKISKKD